MERAVQHVEGLAIESKACPQHHCPVCAAGKQHHDPFPVSCPFELVHTDLSGPAHVPGPGGVVYLLTITDDFTCCADSNYLPTSVKRPYWRHSKNTRLWLRPSTQHADW